VVGVVTAASPLAFWWLDPSTVYALGLVLMASVYIYRHGGSFQSVARRNVPASAMLSSGELH
jgi:hypothetical protein